MPNSGKKLRLSRFRRRGARGALIVPMDHGLTIGPVEGLESLARISSWLSHPAIDGVILHKGMAERLTELGLLDQLGVMIHLNGMSALARDPDRKEMLTSVESALRLGADAVSVQLNFDGANDGHNLALLGSVVDRAQEYGLPVLTMLYDKAVPKGATAEARILRLRHLMRACVELGTDAIKIAPPASLGEVATVLDGFSELAQVYYAGGEVMEDRELLALARESVHRGGAGLCVGRNVFQRPSPEAMLEALREELGDELSENATLPLRSRNRRGSELLQ